MVQVRLGPNMFRQYGNMVSSASASASASAASSGVWANGQQCPFGISMFDTLVQSDNGSMNGESKTKYNKYDTCIHYHKTLVSFKEGYPNGQVFLESSNKQSKQENSSMFSLGRSCANPDMGSTSCPTTTTTTTTTSKKIVSLAVCGLVFSQDNKLLLTRRPSYMRSFPSAWVFPGGSFDDDVDTSLEGAISREVYEETGIQIPPAKTNEWKLECLWESTFPTTTTTIPMKRHHLVFYLSTKLNQSSNDVKLKLCDTEVDAATWLSPDTIDSILSNNRLLTKQQQNDNNDIRGFNGNNNLIDIILHDSSSKRKESLDQLIGIYPRTSLLGVHDNDTNNNSNNMPPSGLAQGSLFALEEYWYSNDKVKL